jgi:ribosomal protein S18 acetylase RimI-like enzyme
LPSIRQATHADAAPLSRLAEGIFRETFAAVNTAENMDLHCRASYGAGLQANEIANPAMATLLAIHGDELIGFAQLRWGSTPAFVPGNAPGEIQRIYVASPWQGKGIAQALMNACLEEFHARGTDVAWLGVWERNPRAIAFYRKLGFIECGAHVFPLGRDPQRDIVMAHSLRPGA